MTYLLLLINVFVMSSGQLLFKQSAIFINNNSNQPFLLKYLTNPWFYGALVLYGISTILWTQVLTKIQLSVAYPIVSVSYIIVLLGASFFFQEKITITSMVAIGFIITGVSLIALK